MPPKKYGDAYDGEFFRPDAEFFRPKDHSSSSSNTQGPSKKDGCFVAGVIYAGMAGSAYGGGDVEQVNVLREYRDDVLMQDALGKKFVDWYYHGGGEKMTEFVGGKRRFLIPIIRRGLDFIVEDYKIRKRT